MISRDSVQVINLVQSWRDIFLSLSAPSPLILFFLSSPLSSPSTLFYLPFCPWLRCGSPKPTWCMGQCHELLRAAGSGQSPRRNAFKRKVSLLRTDICMVSMTIVSLASSVFIAIPVQSWSLKAQGTKVRVKCGNEYQPCPHKVDILMKSGGDMPRPLYAEV